MTRVVRSSWILAGLFGAVFGALGTGCSSAADTSEEGSQDSAGGSKGSTGKADNGGSDDVIKPVQIVKNVDQNIPVDMQVDGKSYHKISSISRIEFPTIDLDAATRQSGTLQFDVPEDAVSFSIVVIADESEERSYVYRLTNPDGKDLISPNPEGVSPDVLTKWNENYGRAHMASPNGVLPEVFISTSITPVPVQPTVQVTPGLWRLTVAHENWAGTTQAEKRRVIIVVKHLAEQAATDALGTLRLNLFFAAGNLVGSTTSLGPSPFETGLKEFSDVFRQLGLIPVLGRMSDIDDRYNNEIGMVPSNDYRPNAEFTELMTGFPLDPGDTNLFFVRYTNDIGYGGIGTLDGASAGYAGVGGIFSGVVVAARLPADTALTTAHELGHHLALYHTDVDSLTDTCSYEHQVEGDQCTAKGIGADDSLNLLGVHPENGRLSPEQLQVVKLRPAITTYNPTN